jgi:hypothetical protein
VLPALPAHVLTAALLNGKSLEFTQTDGSLTVTIPADSVDPIDTIVKLELDQPWITSAVVPVPAQ